MVYICSFTYLGFLIISFPANNNKDIKIRDCFGIYTMKKSFETREWLWLSGESSFVPFHDLFPKEVNHGQLKHK